MIVKTPFSLYIFAETACYMEKRRQDCCSPLSNTAYVLTYVL